MPKLRDEIVARVDKLNLPSYSGFVMPKLTAVTATDGTITDVTISYPQDLTKQMLEFAESAAPSAAVSGSRVSDPAAPSGCSLPGPGSGGLSPPARLTLEQVVHRARSDKSRERPF